MMYRLAAMVKEVMPLDTSVASVHELRQIIWKAVLLSDRYAWSLYMLKTVRHDAPVGITMNSVTFYNADNWTPNLMTTFATGIGVELVFTMDGNSRRNIHSVGREGVRGVFDHVAPYLRQSIITLARQQDDMPVAAKARIIAVRMERWLHWMLTNEERDTTFRKKAGRAVLVDKRRNELIRDRYFLDQRRPLPIRARWRWAHFRR